MKESSIKNQLKQRCRGTELRKEDMKFKGSFKYSLIVLATIGFLQSSQGEVDTSKGIGPISELKLSDLSEATAKQGKDVFNAKCAACHKMTERYVGPALGDVFKRRKPEWIANMILNPVEMTQKDPAAQELLGEYLTQMTFQDVSKDQAQQLVEYFRYFSEKGEIVDPKADVKAGVNANGKANAKKGKSK